MSRQELAETVPQHRMVVDDQHADHALGTPERERGCRGRPPTRRPGRRRRALPGRSAARGRGGRSGPSPAPPAAGKPRPSSSTISSTRVPSVATRTFVGVRVGVAGDVADRLARRHEQQTLGGGREAQVGRHLEMRLDALRLQRRQQIAQRRLEADRVQVRRVDVDQQRPHLAHCAPRRGGGAVEDLGRLDGAARRRPVGRGREAERQAREILHDAVVEVGGDAAPLGVGRVDGADQQLLALLLAAAQAAGDARAPAASGSATAATRPANATRPNVHQASRASDADRGVVAVQLEQHRLARRRAHRRRTPRAACRCRGRNRFSGVDRSATPAVTVPAVERCALLRRDRRGARPISRGSSE